MVIVSRSVASAAVVCVALGSSLVAGRQAQAPAEASPPASGVIVGTVVDEASGKALAGALVSLADVGGGTPAAGSPKPVLTGTDGRFLFVQLRPSLYRVTAARNGYLPSLGAGMVAPIAVDLGPNERRTDVKLPLTKPATISGVVTDERGDPVINVNVSVARRFWSRGRLTWLPGQLSDRTDDRGIYRIGGLVPGDYVLFVEQTLSNAPAAAIDAYQKEVEHRSLGGPINPVLTELITANAPTIGAGTTATQAEGNQVRSLSMSTARPPTPGREMVFATTFFPAASSIAKASTITVKSGDERTGANMTLRPVPAVSVSGRAVGPDGPLALTAVTLSPADGADVRGLSTGQIGTVTDAAGAFTFLSVPEGSYTLRMIRTPSVASSNMVMQTIVNADGSVTSMGSSNGPAAVPPLPPDPTLWAEQPLTVADRDVTGVLVAVHTGARISGRVEFKGSSPQPTPQQMALVQMNVSPLVSAFRFSSIGKIRVSDTGEITSQGFSAGSYLINASPGAALGKWSLESIMTKGVDISQHGLEIGSSDITDLVVTFTDTPAELGGAVTARDGSPAAGAAVIAFPADEPFGRDAGFNSRRNITTRASSTGRFTMRNVVPGAYHVVAIDDLVQAASFEEALLRSLIARSATVTVAAGEKKQQNLPLVTVK